LKITLICYQDYPDNIGLWFQ